MLRMAINKKVAVPRVLILANSRLKNRRALQRRNMLLQVGAQPLDGRQPNHAEAAMRTKVSSMRVKGDLEAAALSLRQRVGQIRVRPMQPDRHLRRTKVHGPRRRPQKENFLPRGKDSLL